MTATATSHSDDISRLSGIIAEQALRIQKSEEECDRHRAEATRHLADLQLIQEALAAKDARIERLEELIALMRHQHFGRRSEKTRGGNTENQLGFFDEAESLEAKSGESDAEQDSGIEIKAHRRRGKPKRIALPADLPREEVIIEIPEGERFCSEGHPLKVIGQDVSEQLDVIPAQVKVITTIRLKYACDICDDSITRAPLPKVAIPKSMAGPGLLAYIATSKYGDGLPLYRQEHMWQRAGIDIPRATMATWMIKVGELFIPLINLLEEILLEGGFVHADETRVQVLREEGKSAESRSYMWVRGRHYPGAPPIVVFEYDPTRSGEVAKRLFAGYQGYLQADAYVGYDGICKQPGIIRCGCLAHARRKFFEAAKASKKGAGLANEAIEIIRRLYEVEGRIKEQSIEERHRIRLAESKPILDEFRTWLDSHLGRVPPQSQLGIALNYTHNEWPQLIRYLEDGRLAIDNNMVENAIRPFAVGRKNWLFSDSVAGAKASAAIYSVMVTAKLNGHNEYEYLRHLLEKLPLAETVEDFEALLPHRLKPQDIPTPASVKATPKSGAVR